MSLRWQSAGLLAIARIANARYAAQIAAESENVLRRWLVIAALLVGGAVATAAANNVSKSASPADAAAAQSVLKQARVHSRPSDFAAEVKAIAAIQRQILAAAPVDKDIAANKPRELTDMLQLGHGLCFDRSRSIETVLNVAGFTTRHVAIYALPPGGTAPLKALMTPGTRSHALTEVKTSRGWMLVDSNSPWLGLANNGHPIDLQDLAEMDQRNLVGSPDEIFKQPFTWVYGLYSRHGKFYEPYLPVPDVNWTELAYNLRP